jgi:hypothetical protein
VNHRSRGEEFPPQRRHWKRKSRSFPLFQLLFWNPKMRSDGTGHCVTRTKIQLPVRSREQDNDLKIAMESSAQFFSDRYSRHDSDFQQTCGVSCVCACLTAVDDQCTIRKRLLRMRQSINRSIVWKVRFRDSCSVIPYSFQKCPVLIDLIAPKVRRLTARYRLTNYETLRYKNSNQERTVSMGVNEAKCLLAF